MVRHLWHFHGGASHKGEICGRPLGPREGENGSLERILAKGEEVEAGKSFQLNQGDVIVLELPGGGGFGATGNRAPEQKAADLADGLTLE